jgi:hypothetical protein
MSSSPVTSYPFSWCLWVYPTDISIDNEYFFIGEASSYVALGIREDGTPDFKHRLRVRAAAYLWGDTVSVNAWTHLGGVVLGESTNHLLLYSDGTKYTGNGATNSEQLFDTVALGRLSDSSPSNYSSGNIAEAAIWNVQLTDAEFASLAVGISPLVIRPQSLVFYVPLVRDNDEDLIGGNSLTAFNSPTIQAHPPIYNPAPPLVVGVPTAVISGEVTWGHDTGVVESNIRDFSGNWTGTGAISGSGDAETICLESGEYMISEVVNTGAYTVHLFQNLYDGTGDDVDLDYRHGATQAACEAAAWNNYTVPFTSLGYVQIRLTSTL